MALRRLVGFVLALAATLTAGCCWCHHHGHRCCYAVPPPGPVVLPACGAR